MIYWYSKKYTIVELLMLQSLGKKFANDPFRLATDNKKRNRPARLGRGGHRVRHGRCIRRPSCVWGGGYWKSIGTQWFPCGAYPAT